jgi:hypothetical protein
VLRIARHAHRCAWLSPTGRHVRSPLMRFLLWPPSSSTPSRTRTFINLHHSPLLHEHRRARAGLHHRASMFKGLLSTFLRFRAHAAHPQGAALQRTFASDLRTRISKGACVSHALANTARIHISPRTSAAPLLRLQHELSWDARLMPRPVGLTQHLRTHAHQRGPDRSWGGTM